MMFCLYLQYRVVESIREKYKMQDFTKTMHSYATVSRIPYGYSTMC